MAGAKEVEEIALKQQSGIFVVPVQINGAITLNFVIDSGAADVQIPVDVFSTLVRAETIHPNDIIGKRTYVLADGTKHDAPVFVLRELQVGNQILRNVDASVGPVAGQLLLGETFLSRFAEWALDNKRHVLKLVEGAAAGTAQEIKPVVEEGNKADQVAAVVPPSLHSAPQPNGRFHITECQSIIDSSSHLEWYVGPDTNMTLLDTTRWVRQLRACGGIWTLPTIAQLRSLFDQRLVAGTGWFERGRYWPAHLDPIFSAIGKGSWVWALGPADAETAQAFNFNQGIPVRISATDFHGSVRAFAVRKTN